MFKFGDFKLNYSMSSNEIMEFLQQEQYVEQDYITITIAEGLNILQIANLAQSMELFSAEDFVLACNTLEFDYSFLEDLPVREHRLEGYLFPDTYFLPKNPEPKDLILRMLNRFDEVYSNLRADTEDTGYSFDEIITMASIIEKEVKREEERGLASSVIYNRLGIEMPLQMCSTVIYVLNKPKDRLLDADLAIQSPYNTYTSAGLPVGPICNPGKKSLEAAINPSKTELLYFVVKDETTGEHEFTSDYNAFLSAKERYNQKY